MRSAAGIRRGIAFFVAKGLSRDVGLRRLKTRWSVFVAVLALFGGIALVTYGELRPLPEAKFKGRLTDVLPKAEEVPGWEIQHEEIADTPEMKKAVSELLNFDDAVFTSYTRGVERISIYIAYWKPGRMSHRLVAGHTPDVCWVGSGWTIVSKSENALVFSGGERTWPAQRRQMSRGKIGEVVLFWHFAGRDLVSYRAGVPPWHAVFTDVFKKRFEQRQEQIFLRVSAPVSFRDDSRNQVMQILLGRLAAASVPISAIDGPN